MAIDAGTIKAFTLRDDERIESMISLGDIPTTVRPCYYRRATKMEPQIGQIRPAQPRERKEAQFTPIGKRYRYISESIPIFQPKFEKTVAGKKVRFTPAEMFAKPMFKNVMLAIQSGKLLARHADDIAYATAVRRPDAATPWGMMSVGNIDMANKRVRINVVHNMHFIYSPPILSPIPQPIVVKSLAPTDVAKAVAELSMPDIITNAMIVSALPMSPSTRELVKQQTQYQLLHVQQAVKVDGTPEHALMTGPESNITQVTLAEDLLDTQPLRFMGMAHSQMCPREMFSSPMKNFDNGVPYIATEKSKQPPPMQQTCRLDMALPFNCVEWLCVCVAPAPRFINGTDIVPPFSVYNPYRIETYGKGRFMLDIDPGYVSFADWAKMSSIQLPLDSYMLSSLGDIDYTMLTDINTATPKATINVHKATFEDVLVQQYDSRLAPKAFFKEMYRDHLDDRDEAAWKSYYYREHQLDVMPPQTLGEKLLTHIQDALSGRARQQPIDAMYTTPEKTTASERLSADEIVEILKKYSDGESETAEPSDPEEGGRRRKTTRPWRT